MQLLDEMHIRQLALDSQKEMMAQLPAYIEQMFGQSFVDDPDLTPQERKQADAESKKSVGRVLKRMQELFAQKIDAAKNAEDVSAELYDKYYSADEIKDLIAFYNTPTGQKTISIMPKLMKDVMEIQMQHMGPTMQAIMKQVMTEEVDRIKHDIEPPAKKTAPTKKSAAKKPSAT